MRMSSVGTTKTLTIKIAKPEELVVNIGARAPR